MSIYACASGLLQNPNPGISCHPDFFANEQGEAYIETLKAIGFKSIAEEAESVSIGMLMQKDSAKISVSAADGVMGIYIRINNG